MADLTTYPQEDNFSTRLAAQAAAADVTITVNSSVTFTFSDPFYIVVEPGTSNAEPMKVTAISGTTWTVTRAQKRYTGDSGSAIAHPAGSTVIISDNFASWDDIKTAVNAKVDNDADDTITADTTWSTTTKAGVIINSLTTTQRDALASAPNGATIYNSTVGQTQWREGGAWVTNASGGTVADASETVAGKIELATNAEMGTGTTTGGTGARLVAPNDQLVKTSSGAGDENKIAVLDSNGQFASGFINTGAIDVVPAGAVMPWTASSAPTGYLLCDGASVSNDTYATLLDLFNDDNFVWGVGTTANAFTADSGTDTFTDSSHGLNDGERVYVRNSGGALPSGLTADTIYFIISATTNTFQLSLTSGGSAVVISDNGTGTQNWYNEFKVPDLRGRYPLGKDNMGGASANRVTAAAADSLAGSGGAETHTLTVGEMPAHTHDVTASAETQQGGGGATAYTNTGTLTSTSTGGGGAHNNMPPYITFNYIIKT